MDDKQQWDGEPIPVERWGKDHWSTFAYVETRVVDYGGRIDDRHMRGHLAGWEQYATRLREPDGTTTEIFGHSDYDCLRDAISFGLLECSEDGYSLTPRGRIVAGKLRAHKGEGANFHTFDPGPTAGWWAAPATA